MDAEQFKQELTNALLNSGPCPRYHYDVMIKHRKEWPALWDVIDRFMNHQGTIYSSKKLSGELK